MPFLLNSNFSPTAARIRTSRSVAFSAAARAQAGWVAVPAAIRPAMVQIKGMRKIELGRNPAAGIVARDAVGSK